MKMAMVIEGVITECYGQRSRWNNRYDAIAYFREGMASCDPNSSEYSRYATIVAKLETGATLADDKE